MQLKRLTFVAIAVTLVSLACVGCSSVGKSVVTEPKAGALMTLEINGVQVNFHWAPAGTFLMGSPGWEREREDCEKRHRVTLTRGFWIAETETTQELWQAVCDTNPSHFTDSPQLPVENVSWYDCQDFIDRLNDNHASVLPSGYKFALPTEAQWEYACRAGTKTPFNFGRKADGTNENSDGNSAYGTKKKGSYIGKTTPVKSYAPNKWGLYDMHGNVAEWTSDWFGSDYYTTPSAAMDPVGPDVGFTRVLRDTGYSNGAHFARSAARYPNWPGNLYKSVGFRLVLVDESQLQERHEDVLKTV